MIDCNAYLQECNIEIPGNIVEQMDFVENNAAAEQQPRLVSNKKNE